MTVEHRERVYPATGRMETVFTRISQIGVRAEILKVPAYVLIKGLRKFDALPRLHLVVGDELFFYGARKDVGLELDVDRVFVDEFQSVHALHIQRDEKAPRCAWFDIFPGPNALDFRDF